MIDAWIVVREEEHIDDRFWVCLVKDDALKIAGDVTAYWKDQYDIQEADENLYGDQVFHFDAEDAFRVYVKPQQIRELCENENFRQ